MHVFEIRNRLIDDYKTYIDSFINIRDERIKAYVRDSLDSSVLWPDPLIQLNPAFEPGEWIDDLVADGILHSECSRIFRANKRERHDQGEPLRLHRHQSEAIRIAQGGHNYVLTTGTGSGKSLAYIVPIVDHVLRRGSGRGIQAIVVYPMNALANSQQGELEKFLNNGYPDGKGPVTFAKYTGQESDEERQVIWANPPDILLTNYVMLELILTRPIEKVLVTAAQGLRFLVLDELHTYRGRQGADIALLVRRVRDQLSSPYLQIVGTSATLAGEGTYAEQRAEVAALASQMFGAEVRPEHVIGETLRRVTPERDLNDPAFVRELTQRVADPDRRPPRDYESFVRDPLSIWIESTFGLTTEPASGRLVRRTPQSIFGEEGAARQFSRLTGLPVERCAQAIQEGLLAGYWCEPDPDTGFRPFAFRLHQFISRGDTVYTSLEPEDVRYITVHGQQFKPGSRDHVLLPLVFCRECGQEYFCVRKTRDESTGLTRFIPRDLGDQFHDDRSEAGFLYLSARDPWPSDDDAVLKRLPGDWVEDEGGVQYVLKKRREYLPEPVRVASDGSVEDEGLECAYLSAPFRFCLHCGVSYDFRQRSDFSKLASLSSEGRSTATSLLSLSAIRNLRQDADLSPEAQKLLSFTDNRQDASLQAGHFNDFVEIGLLRSALYRAVQDAPDGLHHENLTQKVFEALNLPLASYASNPEVRFQALRETERALRDVLGYRLYRDLKRGWRVTLPNLEQCGLLEIRYVSLDEVCEAEDVWENGHPALAEASPETRMKIAKVLLDHMRRELAIKVDYLNPYYQERLQQQSSQYLVAPWALDENEALEYATVLYPRSRRPDDHRGYLYLSARSSFGQYLRRPTTFEDQGHRLDMGETEVVIKDLLEGLRLAGLVEVVHPAQKPEDVPGYQLPAAAIRWVASDGTRAFRDPIRVPNEASDGGKTNPFFVAFYRTIGATLHGLEAREHTAQVPYEERQEREQRFRKGTLPILYCSPTMELGVDIAELNLVNMRNIPPTPANYAQRGGRAGRSGQPALVFSYCSTGSPHDQYFFKRPERMVSGAVTPPRLDLTNEDLVRAHVHAIWLAETGLSLGKSLKDILDLSGEQPTLALLEEVRDHIEDERAAERARARAQRVLTTLGDELRASDWYSDQWLDEVFAQVARRFDQTCDRWRSLYRAALRQREIQNRIIGDASRSAEDKNIAKRLRREAEAQLELLTEVDNLAQSDFYSYRYFASEGFLPGYSFPRLPISAFIPARRTKQKDEFLSRPRFLAISEFGPRAVVYHEGSRYLINKVILPVGDEEQQDEQGGVPLREAKLCGTCGYLHPIAEGEGPDLCQSCGAPLDTPLRRLFRMQNVSTKRRDKISSDEEERMRLGYEIITGVRFGEQNGQPSYQTATVEHEGSPLAHLSYGHTATIWRINLGWTRRKEKSQYGFVLDMERGYWARNEDVEEDDLSDPMSPRKTRVIPYVEDRRNCLLFEPSEGLEPGTAISLMSALSHAIQAEYQLEDDELAAETLPSSDKPRQILFYESAEGGAGVLKRLVDDPQAFSRIARRALDICHFDPDTGADLRRAPRAKEDCEAACYDCLMSYSNQRYHRHLDRQAIRDILMGLMQASVRPSPGPKPRADHLAQLMWLAGSELEREWLRAVEARGLRLPAKAQPLIAECHSRPDFLYDGEVGAAIYIDGPVHDYPHRHERDVAQTELMEDSGYIVIRFGHRDDWAAIFAKYPGIFGRPS